jgi:F-type H+-transporting ATPase subunit delta
MRGASRVSLAQASEQLSSLATTKATADKLGDELFAVVSLLDSEHGLRRALTDPARAAEAKAGLIRSLLEGKVSVATLDLLTGLVSARWSLPRDLADATEQLAVRAVVISADKSRKLDDLEDELFRFSRVVATEPGLREALTDPTVPDDGKRQLLDTLLGGKVTPITLRLVTEMSLHPRGRSLVDSLDTCTRIAAERRRRLIAVVRTATDLTEPQRQRLAQALAGIYGHEVYVNVVIDPTTVGGMTVQIGDELIDGSMSTRLGDLRRKLTN